MNMPARLTAQQVDRDVQREMNHIRDNHPVRPENPGRKCRVCVNPEAKRRVNTMLGHMMRPQEIVENLADLNAGARKNQRIGYWSVRDHRENHFKLQEPTKDAWRRTIERRAAEEGEQIAEGVGNILTARGYLEVIATKGFRELIKQDTAVAFDVGLDAQLKLEQLVKADEANAERAAIRRDVALIQQAIVDTLSPEQMKAVSHRLSVLRGDISEDDETIDGEIDDEYDDYVADVGPDDEED